MNKIANPAADKTANDRTLVDTGRVAFRALRDAHESAVHKRLAQQITPWGVGLTVAGSAFAGLALNPPFAIATGGLAAAAITAGLYTPHARRRPFLSAMAEWARGNPVHTIICGIAAWVWYTAAIMLGVAAAPALITTGLAALFLLSARWWQENRIGYPTDEEIAEVMEEITPEPAIETDQIVRKWETRVAISGGALPGTRLSGCVKVKAGFSYKLHLVEGKQTLAEALAAMPKVATALNVPQRNLLVEDQPFVDGEPEPDPAVLQFQVITNSPIRSVVPLEGPTWDRRNANLWVNLGPFADGEGEAIWKIFSENSMWGGYCVGDTGAGKSCISEIIAMSAMDTGLITVFYIDPQNGTSSPALFDCADWAIGNDAAKQERMLSGLEYLIEIRGAENRITLGTGGFTPGWVTTIDGERMFRPGVLVIVDESHNVFGINAPRWGKVAREGRKVGVAVIALSQIYGLDAFGGDDGLRQSLTGANTIGLRVGRNQASIMNGMPLSPADLPNIPGYGIAMATEMGNARTAPFRSRYAHEKLRREMMRRAAAKMPKLDDLAVGALDTTETFDEENPGMMIRIADRAYSRRDELAEVALAEQRRMLDDLRKGSFQSFSRPAPQGNGMDTLPALNDFLEEALPREPSLGLTGLKRVLFEAVREGVTETAALVEIATERGFSGGSYLFDVLQELVAADLIRRGDKKGTYRPAEKATTS